jgi:hypothetical protein
VTIRAAIVRYLTCRPAAKVNSSQTGRRRPRYAVAAVTRPPALGVTTAPTVCTDVDRAELGRKMLAELAVRRAGGGAWLRLSVRNVYGAAQVARVTLRYNDS